MWPNGPLPATGGQLTVDVSGNLTWADADSIPWTAKGQLIVGTGINTDTILNVGTDTSFLQADSTTASGLIWSNANTGAALLPVGNTAQRVAGAVEGQIRYNSSISLYEGYQGNSFGSNTVGWKQLSIMPVGPTDGTGNLITDERIFYYNALTINTNYTVAPSSNAMSAGPITITPGVTVAVSVGSTWSVI